MIYYANPSTEAIRDEMSAGRLGCIIAPHQGNIVFPDEWDVIADNGCFGGNWSHNRWLRWLVALPRSVRFVVVPDVFTSDGADCHQETLALWDRYSGTVERHGFTPAFVCQVGATADNLPDGAAVLFLGGTTEWKLGPDAWGIVQRWRTERWCHMGRVNSRKRLSTARAMGCHSVDGTYLTYGPDTNLPRLLRWLEAAGREPMLWENPA